MKTDVKSDGKAETGTDAGTVRGGEDVRSKVWLPWSFGGDPPVDVVVRHPNTGEGRSGRTTVPGRRKSGQLHAVCLIFLTGFCELWRTPR